MQYNTLMLMDVADLLERWHQSVVRCGGKKGATAFDELVERHRKPVYQILRPEESALIECQYAPSGMEGRHYGINVRALKHKYPEGNFDLFSETESGGINLKASVLSAAQHATGLTIAGCAELVFLPQEFLRKWAPLESFSLAEETNIESTPSHFLGRCISLKEIDLKPLAKVTTVRHRFLEDCGLLRAVDLSPMVHITSISDCFLKGCRTITEIDLAPLSRVTDVGQWFLAECQSLKAIDLKPISNITAAKWGFLMDCSSLKKLDLAPLSKVTRIGAYFLSGCTSLELVDLSPLTEVVSIGENFTRNVLDKKVLVEALKRNKDQPNDYENLTTSLSNLKRA